MVVLPGFEPGVRRFDSYPRNSREQLLRGRLTVGRGALNALVLVRFQPPQLSEAIRPDEDAVLKTAGRASDLGVRVPRLPLNPMRSCGLAAKAASLQEDDRWFESTQDYS